MTLPTGAFGNVLTAFAGTLSAEDQADIWAKFKAANGLSTNPADSDLQALGQFVSYVESATAGTITALSPDEIQKRVVLSGTFRALIALMMQFGQNLLVGSDLVQFYQKWQGQYTKEMEMTPLYAPNPTNLPNLPGDLFPDNGDRTRAAVAQRMQDYTLGYDNLSFGDIVDSIINSSSSVNSSGAPVQPMIQIPTNFSYNEETINGVKTGTGQGYLTILASTSSDGFSDDPTQVATYITVTFSPGSLNGAPIQYPTSPSDPNGILYRNANFQLTARIIGDDPVTRTQSASQTVAAMLNGLANNGFISNTDPTRNFSLNWSYPASGVGIDPNTNDAGQIQILTQIQQRSNRNARNQQFITTAKSRRDTIAQLQGTATTSINSSRTNAGSDAALIRSVMATLQAIMVGLFRG